MIIENRAPRILNRLLQGALSALVLVSSLGLWILAAPQPATPEDFRFSFQKNPNLRKKRSASTPVRRSTPQKASKGAEPVPDPGNIDDLTRAVSLLRKYRAAIRETLGAARRPLGPYPLNASCTWCSDRAWFGFGLCTQNTTQSFSSTVDFNSTRRSLIAALQRADEEAVRFSQRFSPTERWIDNLPEFSAGFNRDADVVLEIQREIAAGNGPNDDQRQRVRASLVRLSNGVERAAEVLSLGASVLAESAEQQSESRASIKQAIADADQSAGAALENTKNRISSQLNQACVDNLVRDHFDPIRREFTSSIDEISSAFQKLQRVSGQAERSLSVLLGNLVNSQTELKGVSDSLEAAGNDQLGSFLARLHLNAAKRQWETLASTVQ